MRNARWIASSGRGEGWQREGDLTVAALGGIGGKVHQEETRLNALQREIDEETKGGNWMIDEEEKPPSVFSSIDMA